MKTIFKINDEHSDRIQIDFYPKSGQYAVLAFGEHVGFLTPVHAHSLAVSLIDHLKSLGTLSVDEKKPAKKPVEQKPADNPLAVFNQKVRDYVQANPKVSYKDARAIVKAQ